MEGNTIKNLSILNILSDSDLNLLHVRSEMLKFSEHEIS